MGGPISGCDGGPTCPDTAGTLLLAGKPYHFHRASEDGGEVLSLRKGYGKADPRREAMLAREAYVDWMSR